MRIPSGGEEGGGSFVVEVVQKHLSFFKRLCITERERFFPEGILLPIESSVKAIFNCMADDFLVRSNTRDIKNCDLAIL